MQKCATNGQPRVLHAAMQDTKITEDAQVAAGKL